MKEDFLFKLDQGQRQAVTSTSQYILCLAGAGSGKTRVLTTRIFYLIDKLKIEPENILAITFTKAAAREMLFRLKLFGTSIQNLWCRTFHSACFGILKEQNLKPPKIIEQILQDKIMKQCVADLQKNKNFAYDMYNFLEENNWTLDLFFEEIFKVIKECKSKYISPEELKEKTEKAKEDEILEFFKLTYPIFQLYQKRLKELGVFDFSDLMNQTISLLSNDKTILDYYQKKFKFVLVDEFQDVNLSQVKLLTLIGGENNSLFVVGDDWQSIYGFRGGNVQHILDFKKIHRPCENIILPYNYRSDRYLVDAASKIIRNNSKQIKKKIKAWHLGKIKIKIVRAKNKAHQDILVINTVKKLISSGIKQKEIMILGRTWRAINVLLESLPKLGLGGVKITTIHSAKGLEAKVVFLVGLTKKRGGFPQIIDDFEIMKILRETERNERLEEERRIFYVAITRAKKMLFLVTEKDNESMFLSEVPRKYTEEIDF